MKIFLITALFSILASISFLPASAEAQYVQLPIKIERYMANSSEINVRSYLQNSSHYVGFQLVAVEIVAGALNESASMTVQINGTRQGPTLELGQGILNFRIFPNAAFIIGQGAEEIILRTTRPAFLKSVNLILSR